MTETKTDTLVGYDGSPESDLALTWAARCVIARAPARAGVDRGRHLRGTVESARPRLGARGGRTCGAHPQGERSSGHGGVSSRDRRPRASSVGPGRLDAGGREPRQGQGRGGAARLGQSARGPACALSCGGRSRARGVVREPDRRRDRRLRGEHGGARLRLPPSRAHRRGRRGRSRLERGPGRGRPPRAAPRRPRLEARGQRAVAEREHRRCLHRAPGRDRPPGDHPGGPAQALVDASTTASLAVVGSRGRGAFTGMLLGSVSHEVLCRAHCPVAIVR